MRVRIKDIKANISMVGTLMCFVVMTWLLASGNFSGVVAYAIFGVLLLWFAGSVLSNKKELSTLLATPILLSVFQNVYLGMFAPRLSKTNIQILTVLNFLISCILLVTLLYSKRSMAVRKLKIEVLLVAITIYSLLSMVFLDEINAISIISSLRNIVSVFMFFMIGALSYKKIDFEKFENILLVFGFFVMIVGIADVLAGGTMWKSLNITDLWTKKGIAVQASGLPTNFYSSETINGQRIRRMASTFADPVNLGAFLLAVFCIAWKKRNKFMQLLMIVGTVLSVSKGAWLGLLIFASVYAYYNFDRIVFGIVLGLSGISGVGFLLYASATSANSVFLHISGLLAAFRGLLTHPHGSGLGSNGVLARQFSGFSVNLSITESGLGMIMGQLGIAGLIIYILFFQRLVKTSIKIEDQRNRIAAVTLVLSVIANIFFNEVALSPNSCAIYFLVVGYYCEQVFREKCANNLAHV